MTDEEILREAAAFKKAGNRGESASADGTPEGTYVWKLMHHPAAVTVARWTGSNTVKITKITGTVPFYATANIPVGANSNPT